MINSLKEISNKVKEFATRHEAVNEYNIDDFNKFTSDDHDYPMIWATPVTFELTTGQATYGMNISLMSTVYDNDELIQVLSDLADTLGELMSYIDDDSEMCNYYASIDATFQPFFRSIDNVAGWQGQISFRTSYQGNVNTIRFKS